MSRQSVTRDPTPDHSEPRRSLLPGQALHTGAEPIVTAGRGGPPVTAQLLRQVQRRAGNAAAVCLLRSAPARPSSDSTNGAGPVIQRKGGAKPIGSTTITTTDDTYDVEADTLEDAAAIFAARDESGETTWQPDHSVDLVDGVVVKATVTVPVQVLMPKWAGAAKLSKAGQAEWKRAYGALKKHEQHHGALVTKFMKDLHAKMIGKTEAEADQIFNDAVAALQKASDDYDTKTKHGQTEGTDLNTSVP
ncbi:MAG: hypothetical protein NVSMB32_02220 [Actinomycetota bacterium]